MLVELNPHPETPCGLVADLEVEIRRERPARLTLSYTLSGSIGDLRLPERAEAARRDGLWQRTCFELFLRSGDGEAYAEFNLSPSTEWAAYGFDGYREGMRDLTEVRDPGIEFVHDRTSVTLRAELDLAGTGFSDDEVWHAGLSVVVVDSGGTRSFWALNHPPGAPDFHHGDCFALELPPAP